MEPKKAETAGCHVNVKLIPPKIAYFIILGGTLVCKTKFNYRDNEQLFFFSAHASLFPYLPVYMGLISLTPIQMSIIFGVALSLSAPIRVVVGYIADRFRMRKMAFAVASILTVMFHLSLYFIPSEEPQSLRSSDYSMQGSLCYRSGHFALEAFNKTVTLHDNYTNDFNMSEINCCLEDVTNTSYCHHVSFKEISDNLTLVNNIRDVKRWFSSRNLQAENQSLCIDFQYCNRTTFTHFETSDNQRTFWLFFILYFFAFGSCTPLYNLLDSLVYSLLKITGRPEDFGKTRLWGTIGFGFSAFLSGLIQDALSKQGWKGKETFVISFVNFSIGSLLAIVLISITKAPTEETSENSRKPSNNANSMKNKVNSIEPEIKPFQEEAINEPHILENAKDVMKIMCGFYLTVIITTGLVAGTCAGCLEVFFYYFLVSLDPENKSVLGICLAVSCTCEAIVLFFSGRIQSLLGSKICLYLVFVVFPIRFVACSFLEIPWYGLIIDATQCICFGLLYPLMTSWASSLVPGHLQNTVQCYLGATYISFGEKIASSFNTSFPL